MPAPARKTEEEVTGRTRVTAKQSGDALLVLLLNIFTATRVACSLAERCKCVHNVPGGVSTVD